jgi:hypothetical protein
VTDDWVASQAPAVLARARELALERAVERLAGELTETLVATARRDRPAPAPTATPAPTGELLWCYGVTAGNVPEVEGIDDAPVLRIGAGELTALASPVPAARFDPRALEAELEDLARLEQLARAHERVLAAALDAGDVVPFRLCTIYSGEPALRAALADRGSELAEALRLVHGAAEWSVKVLHRPVADRQPAAPAGSGTEYLTRRRDERAYAEASADAVHEAATAVHARLTEHAAGAVLARPQDRRLSGHEGEMVLNAAYLVPYDRLDDFRALVEELAARFEEQHLHFQLTGPWPAHHFTDAATA